MIFAKGLYKDSSYIVTINDAGFHVEPINDLRIWHRSFSDANSNELVDFTRKYVYPDLMPHMLPVDKYTGVRPWEKKYQFTFASVIGIQPSDRLLQIIENGKQSFIVLGQEYEAFPRYIPFSIIDIKSFKKTDYKLDFHEVMYSIKKELQIKLKTEKLKPENKGASWIKTYLKQYMIRLRQTKIKGF